ncbi:MAG: sugar phosphate isomerase/epimerase [Clostridiales bacterium]|nr:sugar phosphate isomerase/epimerase [Clostridiales bacterium]
MKLGVSSYSFAQYMRKTNANYFEICDIAKRIGFDGIEFIDLHTEVQPAESVEALAKDIHDYCEKIGLTIVAYTVGADFMKDDPKAELERLKKCVDVAAILGARTMRHDITWRTDVPWREIIANTKDLVRELTVYAASKGVRTCTENHGFVMQDADRMEQMMIEVGHENYGWLVDMGNFLCGDDQTMHAVPIAAPYAFHVHVKDFLVKPFDAENPGNGWFKSRNGNYLRGTVAGHGVVPIGPALKIIKDAGYDGFVSYEFEGMEDNIPALEAAYEYISRVMPK